MIGATCEMTAIRIRHARFATAVTIMTSRISAPPRPQPATVAGGAADVRIVHVAHLVRVIEVLDCNQQVIYSEAMLPVWQNDRWFLPMLDVIRRAQALRELYGLVEREEG